MITSTENSILLRNSQVFLLRLKYFFHKQKGVQVLPRENQKCSNTVHSSLILIFMFPSQTSQSKSRQRWWRSKVKSDSRWKPQCDPHHQISVVKSTPEIASQRHWRENTSPDFHVLVYPWVGQGGSVLPRSAADTPKCVADYSIFNQKVVWTSKDYLATSLARWDSYL